MSIHEDQIRRWMTRYRQAIIDLHHTPPVSSGHATKSLSVSALETELQILIETQRKDVTYEMAKELAEGL